MKTNGCRTSVMKVLRAAGSDNPVKPENVREEQLYRLGLQVLQHLSDIAGVWFPTRFLLPQLKAVLIGIGAAILAL